VRFPPIPLKKSKNRAPQKFRQIRWRVTLPIQRRPESIAVVLGGFSARPAGPPHLFYNANSKGRKILISLGKRVFQHRVMVGGSSPDEDRLSG
jgi:hypothetical protein